MAAMVTTGFTHKADMARAALAVAATKSLRDAR